MSDDVARAVGAGGSLAVTIAGKEHTVRPLGIRELLEIERDCLERYRRQYLESYSRNLDLLPDTERTGLMERKLEATARWDVDNLPPKWAHDPSKITLTDPLRRWLVEQWNLEGEQSEPRLCRLAAASLDQETLTAEEYRRLAENNNPPRVRVPYVNWWITGSYDGMITLIWTCFRKAGVSREQTIDAVGSSPVTLNELAREIEKLSAPQAGNG